MARRKKRIESEEAEVNITPMMDIVFILLIFFIVTASFVKEAGIDVTKPNAQTAEQKERANILIAIDKNNQVWINRRIVDIRAVTANVQRLLAENPESSVVIQADEKSENGTFVKVMDNTKLAGVDNIAIAARPIN